MDFLSEGMQAESGLWLPDLHYKCWVHGLCATWRGCDGHKRCHSLLCERCDTAFSFQVGASYSGAGCLLPVWIVTGNLTKAHPGKSLMIFSHSEKESLLIPGCCQMFPLSDGVCLFITAQELWGGRCEALWEACRVSGRQELSGLWEFIVGFSHRWQACQWAVVSCRFAWSVNLNKIPERWWG